MIIKNTTNPPITILLCSFETAFGKIIPSRKIHVGAPILRTSQAANSPLEKGPQYAGGLSIFLPEAYVG
ncbi:MULTISPECIES: hypothetical protein [Blautia]|nr:MULTISPECIES: hypothetical protein [Blautia]